MSSSSYTTTYVSETRTRESAVPASKYWGDRKEPFRTDFVSTLPRHSTTDIPTNARVTYTELGTKVGTAHISYHNIGTRTYEQELPEPKVYEPLPPVEDGECIGRRERIEYIYDTSRDAEFEARIRALQDDLAALRGRRVDEGPHRSEIRRLRSEADVDETRIAALHKELATVRKAPVIIHDQGEVRELRHALDLRNERIVELKEALVAARQVQPAEEASRSEYEHRISILQRDIVDQRGRTIDVAPYEREITQLQQVNGEDQARIRHLRDEIERVKAQLNTPAPAPRAISRDLSKCPPFVGFGLVEKTNLSPGEHIESLPVESLWTNGPAEKAGLRLDDQVYAIGKSNSPIQSLQQVQTILETEARVGEDLRIVARHANETEKFTTHLHVGTVGEACRQHSDVFFDRSKNEKRGGGLSSSLSQSGSHINQKNKNIHGYRGLKTASIIEFDALPTETVSIERDLLPSGQNIVNQYEPNTPLWYGLKHTPLLALKQVANPNRFAIIDFFYDQAGLEEHFQGQVPSAVRDQSHRIQGGFEDGVLANANSYDILATPKILSDKIPYARYMSFTTLRASEGKQQDVRDLLLKGLRLANESERKTSFFAPCQSQKDPNDFAIICIIDDDEGLNTHFVEPAVVPSALHKACKNDPNLVTEGFEAGVLANIRLFSFADNSRKNDFRSL